MGYITDYANKSGLQRKPVANDKWQGGTYSQPSLSSRASISRLIEAFRSQAPGGWSDDRWEQSKHYQGILYICSHRMSEQLAQAEFQVSIRDPKHPQGKREVTERDPPQGGRMVSPWDLVRLLQRPNEEDSFGDLMYNWNMQMDLTGQALTWMLPNQMGVPMELYSIPTAIAIPQPTINPEFPKGFYRIQPVYPYGPFSSSPTPASAVGAPIPGQWMLKFKYPHPFLRYDGYSPQTAMRLHIDEVEMIDRSRFYSMKRSVNPSAVLNFDELEGMTELPRHEVERIHAEWENDFQGVENHGRIIVGVPGGKIEPWGQKPADMEYDSGWNQLTSFIMAAMGITKPAAGMIEDSSYSTLFATLKQLHLLTLEPKVNRIASRMTRVLAPFFGDDLIIEIRCKRIDDHEVTRANVQTLTQAQAITKGEVRQAMGFPLTGEKWEDDIVGQEQQQPGMPGAEGGMPGMPGAEGMPGAGAGAQAVDPAKANIEDVLGWAPDDEDEDEESDMVSSQPDDDNAAANVDDVLGWKPLNTDKPPKDEIEKERPSPGNLSQGALGPRKSFNGNGHHKTLRKKKVKSMYQQIREVCREW